MKREESKEETYKEEHNMQRRMQRNESHRGQEKDGQWGSRDLEEKQREKRARELDSH